MSKLVPDNPSPLRDNIRDERQVPKENKFIGTKRLKPGHKMFKYHKGTVQELGPEDYYEVEIDLSKPKLVVYTNPDNIQIGNFTRDKPLKVDKKKMKNQDTSLRKKIRIEPDTYYWGALNIQNAVKYFKKIGLSVQILK